MAFTPEQHKQYRESLKSSGVCTLCHKRPERELGKLCWECLERTNEASRRDNKRAYEQGLCRNCKKNKGTIRLKSRLWCEECRDKEKERWKNKQAILRQDKSRCRLCYRKLDEFSIITGRRSCQVCSEKESHRDRTKDYERRKELRRERRSSR